MIQIADASEELSENSEMFSVVVLYLGTIYE